MSQQAIRVLLLDDEVSLRKPLNEYLCNAYGFIVDAVANGFEAIHLLEEAKGNYDIALLDEVLAEGPSGIDVLREIKDRFPEVDVILFTGWGMNAGMDALHAGAYRYFAKPFDKDELGLTIRFAAAQKRIRKEHDYMKALVKAGQALTRSTHLEEQLEIVWDFVREQLAAPTCFVGLYDAQTDSLHFPLSYDEGKLDPLPSLTLGPEQSNWGLAGFVIKTGQEQVWSTRVQAEKDWNAAQIKSRFSPGGPSESGICLPLRSTDEIWGVLSVQSYEPYAFDQAFLNAVRALGSQVSVTLENSRLVRETRLKALNLEKLQDLTLAINSTLDLKYVLTQTCQAVVELVGVDHSGLVLFDPDLARGKVFAEYPPTEKTVGRIIPVRGIAAEEQLVLQHEVVNIPDLTNTTSLGPIRDILLEIGIQSTLIVPIIFNQKVVASFSLDAMQKTRAFSASEIEICQHLADQVAVAIENARLISTEQEATRRMKKQADRLRVLYDIGKEITSAREVEPIWDSIAEHLIRLIGARRSLFLLVDTKRKHLIKATGQGYPLEHLQGMTMDEIESGVSGWVLKTKQAVLIDNAQDDPRNTGLALEMAKGFGTAPLIVAPLLINGEAIGTLTVANSEGDEPFEEDDRALVVMLAAQASIAYNNVLRMRELEQLQRGGEALAGVLEPYQVLKQIVESARQIAQADSSAVWSFDNLHNRTAPKDFAASGIPSDQLAKFRMYEPRHGGIAELAMEKGWVPVSDVSDPQYSFISPLTQELLSGINARSFQAVALRDGEENLGVLYLNYDHTKLFLQDDRKILETFANHAALSLKKARLSSQVKKARDAAAAIAEIVALGQDIRDTWEQNVARIADALPCDVVTLYRYNEDTGELGYPPAMAGVKYPERVVQLSAVPKHSFVWKVLQSDDIVIIEDARSDPFTRNLRFTNDEGIQSLVGIPLKSGDRKVGVMFVNYFDQHRFTNDELIHTRLFANQIAVAIRNAQLHERTERQAETLKGLYAAAQAVTGLSTLAEILQQIAEQAWRLAGRHNTYTIIRLVENDSATVVAVYPHNDVISRQTTVPEIDWKIGVNGRIGVTGRAIKTGRSQLVNDVKSDEDYITSDPEVQSELAVPIIWAEHVIGVINVDSPEPGAFNEEDKQTLISLANYAAIAINNARFLERTKAHAETLAGLYVASQVITQTLAIDDVLQHIVAQALRIVRGNIQLGCFSHIALLYKSKLRFVAGFPADILDDLRGSTREIDLQKDEKKGIAGYVALTGQSQMIDEVTTDPNYIPFREDMNVHSQLSVPLRIGERILGVLSIEHPTSHIFSAEDRLNTELLASQASVAIQNAQQFEELQKAYQDVQNTKELLAGRTALAWTGMISSTWRHAIEKHAITIREQTELLRNDTQQLPMKGTIEKRLDMMERLANQILKKPLTAPLSIEEEVQSVHLNAFIQKRLRQLWAHEPYKEIDREFQFELEDSATIRANPDWLQRALDILIDNAADAMEGGSDRKIIVATKRSNRRVLISIGDRGHGISEEVRERLFREPITKPKDAKGLGMGLLFAQMILQTYSGKIKIGTTSVKGTTMVISLPLENQSVL